MNIVEVLRIAPRDLGVRVSPRSVRKGDRIVSVTGREIVVGEFDYFIHEEGVFQVVVTNGGESYETESSSAHDTFLFRTSREDLSGLVPEGAFDYLGTLGQTCVWVVDETVATLGVVHHIRHDGESGYALDEAPQGLDEVPRKYRLVARVG